MKVSASILDCDFLDLGAELDAVIKAGADSVHLDVMDGHFVPNLSFGVPVARAVRRAVKVPVIAHLMVMEPEWLIERMLPFCDRVVFHIEATEMAEQCLETITSAGKSAGVSLNPNTEVATVAPFISRVEEVLVMSVFPGLGGQEFIPEALPRITRIRQMLSAAGSSAVIAVDGGVNPANCRAVAAAGADVVIAGSAIFRSNDYARIIGELKCSTP